MARRGPPRHGATAGKPKEEPETAEPEVGDDEVETVSKLAGGKKFTPEQALDIAIRGYQHAVALKILQRRQEQLRKKLATTTKSIEVHAREISALWDDAQAGQGTLEFGGEGSTPAKAPKPAKTLENASEVAADRYDAAYKGRSLSVTREADGRWTARCATGEDTVHEGIKGEHEERAAAMEHALAMAGFDTKDKRPRWSAAKPPPRAYTLVHGKKLLELVEQEGGLWRPLIDGKGLGGDFVLASEAAEFCLSESGMTASLRTSAKWIPRNGAPPIEDAASPLVEWRAEINGKAAVLRQDVAGKWTARVGDLPVAIDLGLEKAKRLAGVEILKGEPEGATVEWRRVEREAPSRKAAAR